MSSSTTVEPSGAPPATGRVALASDADGKQNLQFLQDSVKSALIDHAQFSRVLTEAERAQHFDEVRKVTERFFARTETLRAKLVEIKQSR